MPFNPSDIPYGDAPFYCFPLAEICMYILFVVCIIHAVKQGIRDISYLAGGVIFGLILEYVNVNANMGYTYGKFMVMLGKAPLDIPLCIGIGWGIIMYSARLFTDQFRLPFWGAIAMDALLAINIDLSMDVVAYRLHMWNWNWSGSNLNPFTADWFGVPFGNFFGWLLVVFFYSSFSRVVERLFARQQKGVSFLPVLAPLMSVLLSQAALYVMLVYIDDYLKIKFGITSLHRFAAFTILLSIMAATGWRKRKPSNLTMPVISWLVPVWFHIFFFAWLFIAGFYIENRWMTLASALNVVLGIIIHVKVMIAKPVSQLQPAETV